MRRTFSVISGLAVLALLLQFYLAGVGVFSMPEDELFALHGWNGRIVLPLLMLASIAFAALAHAGRRTVWLTVIAFGLLVFQTILFILAGVLTGATPPPDAQINTAGTIMLAFHVLNGLAILGVSLVVARRAWGLAGSARAGTRVREDTAAVPTGAAS